MISTSAGAQPDASDFLADYVEEKVPNTVKKLQDERWPFPGDEAMRGKEPLTFTDAVNKGSIVL